MMINLLAIFVASIAGFACGALWYSPFLFGKAWIAAGGHCDSTAKCDTNKTCDTDKKCCVPCKRYVIAFVLSFIAAFIFDIFLGPNPTVGASVLAGFVTGVGWIATSLGTNYLWSSHSLKLFLIDSGHHVVKFMIFGLVLGLMH